MSPADLDIFRTDDGPAYCQACDGRGWFTVDVGERRACAECGGTGVHPRFLDGTGKGASRPLGGPRKPEASAGA